MATINTGSHPKEVWPGIVAFFGDKYKEKDPKWGMVFQQRESSKAYEEIVQRTGHGLAPVKPEGFATTYGDRSQGYTSRFNNVTYSLGEIITMEALADNQYESMAMRGSASLARAMRQTKEHVHADVLNRGFNSSYTGGDGVELLSTAHPTKSGNQSNELAVAADFSEPALEDLLVQIDQARDDKNIHAHIEGRKLVVPSALNFEATRVVSSTNQSGTANNDVNAVKALGLLPEGMVTWSFLTDDDAWFICTDVDEGLLSFSRQAAALTQDNDFDTVNARMKCMERFAVGWADWRGIYGSPGA